MDVRAELNQQQRRAVEHGEGPLLILAGAGSGKTKTLTHRIAHLISQRGVWPSHILAVTFTNKAAREMRQRLADLLGQSAEDRSFMPWMGTFHSICVRLLRVDGVAIGLDKQFVIYDTDDQLGLIKQLMKARGVTERDLKPRAVQAAISGAKNRLLGPEEYARSAVGPIKQMIAQLFADYQTALAQSHAVDFDDLLLKTVELLHQQPAIRHKWQQQFGHILIDEYQDTNAVQYRLIKLLVNQQCNLCVVGDDAQSIYSFRGADYSNILNFERDFPGTVVVKLEQNYRSTGPILDTANALIQHNTNRTDKRLWTATTGGVPPQLWQAYSDAEEANLVAREMQRQQYAGRQYGDMAVLYRTNAQSYALERALRQHYIPYTIVGGVRFLDRAVVKDVLAYLKLLYQPQDAMSFRRIVNLPKRGIGAVTVQRFLAWNQAHQATLVEGLLAAGQAPELTARSRRSLEQLGQLLYSLQQQLDGSPADLLEQIVEQTGYGALLADDSPQSEERRENLGVLIAEARAYADTASFLEDMALMSASDQTAPAGQVTLMTLHAAKGLEFPVVFLVGLEEGVLPHARACDSGHLEELEEERRLCYVGVTRAREELFVSCAASRMQFGQIGYMMPSRFLDEMGLLVESADQPAQASISPEADFYADGPGLEVGDQVRSPQFGVGRVTEVDGLAVVVQFATGGSKKLNVEFARLEKLD